jgi:hypothetical protein
MAQTQTRSKRAGSARSSGQTKRRTGSNATRAKSNSNRSTSTRRKRNSTSPKSAPSAAQRIIDRAKLPAVAGGAALAGLAGGVLAGRRSRSNGVGNSILGIPMPRPKGGTAASMGAAAKEVGKVGEKVGELVAEVRRVRQRVEDD